MLLSKVVKKVYDVRIENLVDMQREVHLRFPDYLVEGHIDMLCIASMSNTGSYV